MPTVKSAGGTQRLKLDYALNAVLEITGVTEDYDSPRPAGFPHTYTYGYDGFNRLTGATYSASVGLANESYAYDAAGNREDPGNGALYDYDANNRITASPGKTYAFDIHVGNTAVRFQPGHRVRLEISSSNFPRYDPNPNTGAEIATERSPVSATQTVFHTHELPSALMLPVVSK